MMRFRNAKTSLIFYFVYNIKQKVALEKLDNLSEKNEK